MSGNPLRFLWADRRRRLPYRRYLDLEDRSRRLAAQNFSLLTLGCGGVYLVWLGELVSRTRGWQDVLFFVAEILAFVLLLFLAFDIWWLRYHRPEGLPIDTPYPVDIFVTYCGEPYEVIKTTLKGASQIDYQPVKVYVLDDKGSSQVAMLAQSLGFNYLSRAETGLPRENNKSGNLNFGLSHSRGELILELDADQVPEPDILTRMAGFFRLPKVAYVQSKQAFCLPNGDPFYNRDDIFYEVVQSSNDQANAVIACGSGVMYRRRALEELGGFVTWNIVEDFTTSYELLSRGWKGIYFPYALSRGLAPATLTGVYRQRFQWCLDTMRLFFLGQPFEKEGSGLHPEAAFSDDYGVLSGERPGFPGVLSDPPAHLLAGLLLCAGAGMGLPVPARNLCVGHHPHVPLSVLGQETRQAIQNAVRPLPGVHRGHRRGAALSARTQAGLPH